MVAKTDYTARETEYESNLMSAYHAAIADNPALFNHGLDWYPLVREQIAAVAAARGIDFKVACGVVAALSPQQGWAMNFANAIMCFDAFAKGAKSADDLPRGAHTPANLRKVWAILSGVDPIFVLGNFGGKSDAFKTRRFCPNLQGDEFGVTVDRHHARLCLGLAKTDNYPQPSGAEYLAMERATQNVARQLGITPARLQSALWSWFRGAMF